MYVIQIFPCALSLTGYKGDEVSSLTRLVQLVQMMEVGGNKQKHKQYRAMFRRFMAIKAAVPGAKSGRVSVERNIPVHQRAKAWERDGKPKDVWFKEKYAHIHAEQKARDSRSGNRGRGTPGRGQDEYGKREAHEQRVRSIKQSQRDSVRVHRDRV